MTEELHNDSHRPLAVPGLNGLPLHLKIRDDEPSFTRTPETDFRNTSELHGLPITARELVMLQVMNDITDEMDWQLKLLDAEKVNEWREAALEIPLMSNGAWDWCLAELKNKAEDFEPSGHVMVLNARSGICKSDVAVAALIHAELKDSMRCLMGPLESERDLLWPSQVVHYVDPSLFPLVYGKTRVMSDGNNQYLSKCLNYSGCGHIAAIVDADALHLDAVKAEEITWIDSQNWTRKEDELEFFSQRFQRLPCEVEFTKSEDVEITSYINNLHPVHNKSTYHTLEKLISSTIPSWNEVLVKNGCPRWLLRIRTWGVDWSSSPGDGWPSTSDLLELEKDRSSEAFTTMVSRIREYIRLLDSQPSAQFSPSSWLLLKSNDWERQPGGLGAAIIAKWEMQREWEHPEPGGSFDYRQWKAGDTGVAVVSHSKTTSVGDHEYYSVTLEENFYDQGLQVIIKMTNIEITPENPLHEGTNWMLDGNLNEHIAATAIYYTEVNNLTGPALSFRQLVTMREQDLNYGDHLSDALAAIFGISNVLDMEAGLECGEFSGYQTIGNVSTPERRLIAWPSVLQHRFLPFQLIDATKSGNASYITLSLVDPYYRICSTRNVPPQRHDWWWEEAIKAAGLRQRIPQEIIDIIGHYTSDWPMGLEEAKNLREDMVEQFHVKMEDRNTSRRPL